VAARIQSFRVIKGAKCKGVASWAYRKS
jgi:hypothetical protein